jgi:hypothetical protein
MLCPGDLPARTRSIRIFLREIANVEISIGVASEHFD